ncbi:MAG TPA: amidohydrolase family protein, partial [Dehalococcoidia bacterium]|nr:amidohydrolase family protein [Dehalococcoidia bacterium]
DNGRVAAPPSRLAWLEDGAGPRRVIYRGPLRGGRVRLHYAFDGWAGDPQEIDLEPGPDGGYVGVIPDTAGHLTVDAVVTNGHEWDNNDEADYRLWLTVDPFDAHLHVSGGGDGALGIRALQVALTSAGISGGVASWPGNEAVARTVSRAPSLLGLVWVRPGVTRVRDVRRYLAEGFAGLKFHPTIDEFPADDPEMDPYLEVAAQAGVPVCIHSAPGDADPDFIRRLAERWPDVPILLYHTYLGPVEGRWRAADHAREQRNLFLETSWCRASQILRFVEEVGPRKVVFGSDASVDGSRHYRRQPPNVEGRETYNDGLLRLIRALDPADAQLIMGDNARRLFRIPPRRE